MRRVIDRDLVSALVLFFIGGVSLSEMGTGMRNWIFPRVLAYLMLVDRRGAGLARSCWRRS